MRNIAQSHVEEKPHFEHGCARPNVALYSRRDTVVIALYDGLIYYVISFFSQIEPYLIKRIVSYIQGLFW